MFCFFCLFVCHVGKLCLLGVVWVEWCMPLSLADREAGGVGLEWCMQVCLYASGVRLEWCASLSYLKTPRHYTHTLKGVCLYACGVRLEWCMLVFFAAFLSYC